MGSGKSTVAEILRAKGFEIIDADKISRKVIEEDKGLLEKLIAAFGDGILYPDGKLNRQELGRRAFDSQEHKRKIDSIMMRSIVKAMHEELLRHRKDGNDKIVVDAPLLFESGYDKYCDNNWAVVTDRKIQIDRVKERDQLTIEEIIDRISRQMPLEGYREKADVIIENNGSKEELMAKIKSLLTLYEIQ